jgi:O-acetyl-ADP-ribose deacetylase (regulator of RNase III)
MTALRDRIEIAEGDIVRLDVDAIVNAANEELLPGGGVCGAIHRAAGSELAAACAKVGYCPTGEARITPGFRLKARHVVHAVGPIWSGDGARDDLLLAGAYRHSLELARKHNIGSIAFPAISTGIYGFPLDRATKVAVATVAEFLCANKLPERVVFACFGADAIAAYRRELARL